MKFLSDHNPLVWLKRQKDTRGKFTRWVQELETFNYQIVYVRGKDNVVADCLSRMHSDVDRTVNEETENFERHIYSFNTDGNFNQRLKEAQQEDQSTRLTLRQLSETGTISCGAFKNNFGVSITNGLLCMGRRVIVPLLMRSRFCTEYTMKDTSGSRRQPY